MKNDGYLSIVTSDKRICILYLLNEKSYDLSEFKSYFGVKSTSELNPRLNELDKAGLITGSSSGYRITKLGKIFLQNYTPFFELTETLDKSPFWKNHDLFPIPDELLYRIHELKKCEVLRIEEHDMFESNKNFINACLNASSFCGAAHIFFKEWINLFSMLAERKIPIEIITTPQIYEKLKDAYPTELELYLRNGAKLYVTNELKVTFSVVSDELFQTSLNTQSGIYDHKVLQGCDSKSVKWGNDLFNYYKESSIEIKSTVSILIENQGVQTVLSELL